MFFSKSNSNYPRLYVQIIFDSFRTYPAWEPSREVRLGDYGLIDKDTGEFMKKGNLIEEGLDDGKIIIKVGEKQEEAVFQSSSLKSLDLGGDVGVNLTGLFECDLKKGWKSRKNPCAGLWVIKPVHSYIDNESILVRIMKDNANLREFSVITEIYQCPAYALFLQHNSENKFVLGFKFSAPIPVLPAVSPSAGLSGAWSSVGSASILRKGTAETDAYVPLFRLRALRPRDRGVAPLRRVRGGDFGIETESMETTEDAELSLSDSYPPWGAIDDDGNELPPEELPWM